jgi:hypothetical protein
MTNLLWNENKKGRMNQNNVKRRNQLTVNTRTKKEA